MCKKSLPMCATVIPARFPHSDSPETENAMRIYKQSQESTHLSTFLQRDLCGRLSVPQNPYGRRLVDVLLENSEGLKENLTEKLASQGFTAYTNKAKSPHIFLLFCKGTCAEGCQFHRILMDVDSCMSC